MPEYIVDIVRIGYSSHTIKIRANSIEEAEQIALDSAGDIEFKESSAEYTIGFCEEDK